MSRLLRLAIAASVICAAACAHTQDAAHPYTLSAEERTVVLATLARDSTWRLAVPSDNRDSVALASMRLTQASFEPYLVRSSSGEGTASFAFAIVREGEFKVFYARQGPTGTYAEGHIQEVATARWLNEGRVALHGDTLDLAPFNSDEVLVFVWDRESARLHLVDEPRENGPTP